MKPKASDVAAVAVGLLSKPTIPYIEGGSSLAGMDCQGEIKYCVRQCGGTLDVKGSNDMYRNSVTRIDTISNARRDGWLVPGCVEFVVKNDGGEVERGYVDGKGNASHVAIYTDAPGAQLVNASFTYGKVCATTEKSGYTHAAMLTCIDYGGAEQADIPNVSGFPCQMTVNTDANGLTFRREPQKVSGVDNRIPLMPRVPSGATVTVLAINNAGWANVTYSGFTGWVSRDFLAPIGVQDEVPLNTVAGGDRNCYAIELTKDEANAIISIADRLCVKIG